MAVNTYEGLFILDSNRYASDPSGSAESITKLLETVGGEILASRLWEERRLAYAIEGHRKGTYWLTYFKLESRKLPEVERAIALSDTILRNMIIKHDPRIADVLVQHALTGNVVPTAAPEESRRRLPVGVEIEE